jgi:hypothetical protein
MYRIGYLLLIAIVHIIIQCNYMLCIAIELVYVALGSILDSLFDLPIAFVL